MTTLFPRKHRVEHTPHEQTAVEIASDDSVEVLGALSSETAQAIVAQLELEPTTASVLSEQVDTSVQNVKYHLEQLCSAGVVEVVDTWYSDRGREMTVYALAIKQLVVQFETANNTANTNVTDNISIQI